MFSRANIRIAQIDTRQFPDAALYWFCRMLDGGADPRYIGRRLLRLASEDVGNADPRAVEITLSALQSFERLDHPKGSWH